MSINSKPNSLARKIGLRKSQLANLFWELKTHFRKPIKGPKVFCIGFHKTGTTSLGEALKLLGYHHTTFYKRVFDNYENRETEQILQYAEKYDSFDDVPWFKEDMIPILDQHFPNSKFIYLERNEEEWVKSFENWSFKLSGRRANMVDWLAQFQSHRKFVLDYFKNSGSDRFIILDIGDPVGFRKLADFLDKPFVADKFPHFNRTD